jgi:hypothetical protein
MDNKNYAEYISENEFRLSIVEYINIIKVNEIKLLLAKIDNDIRLGDSGYYTREIVLQEIKNILGE